MRSSSSLPYLLSIARRGVPFTSGDGQAFVRLEEPSSGGFFILPVRSPAYRTRADVAVGRPPYELAFGVNDPRRRRAVQRFSLGALLAPGACAK